MGCRVPSPEGDPASSHPCLPGIAAGGPQATLQAAVDSDRAHAGRLDCEDRWVGGCLPQALPPSPPKGGQGRVGSEPVSGSGVLASSLCPSWSCGR